MALQPILNQLKPKMNEVTDKLVEDLRTVRTGKASGSLIENIMISYYGAQTPLKNMANITTPDAFLIVVQPWDANALNDIENGLKNSDMGFSTANDGRVIRISLPPLTEERRNDFIKLIHQKAESARIALRNVRQTAWEDIQAEKKSGELTEDDLYQGEKDLNKMIEDANNQIKTVIDAKEKELKQI
ncbi:TPA: ribosome recycling factor [Candidatus Berkelbacteria bacterium]|uniref:Ribosome-recycling factor n=1 Tax=Berkelbacteria bacterium GW2011_GWE1_39_12 TaxID=1618337 RepID=A0A0G4B3K8_9BACT|nr:MAG: frr, ribosome recycling factor, ribosome recycling factor [Berkelbacteria bacterium GW2011_GWE1_39_12]HBO60604.1 ribosome recycling factor [Candidatus Berkelbacteria bacterium]